MQRIHRGDLVAALLVAFWLAFAYAQGLSAQTPLKYLQQRNQAVAAESSASNDITGLNEDAGWHLFETQGEHDIKIGGWMMAGFTGNAFGNRTANGNLPLGLNSLADGPVMHQLWFYFDKPFEPQEGSWDWGFRFDYAFGADAPDIQAFGDGGWDYGWNSSRDYGSAIPQLYWEFGGETLSCMVGHFLTPIGWENSTRPDNFQFSQSYMFYYSQPTAHSGFLASYAPTAALELYGGWVMGWDSGFQNYLHASMFLGGGTLAISDRAELTYIVTAGDFGDGVGKNNLISNAGNLYMHSIYLTVDMSDELQYVFAQDLGINTGLGGGDNEWYGHAHYFSYLFNDRWSAGLRYEWFRDDDGTRVAVNGAGAGAYQAITFTANWQPHPNVVLRPEVRWDWFSGEGQPFNGVDDLGTSGGMFTGGLAVITTY